MPNPRAHPYISATWLPRLLTGEKSCEWAIWFKANYQNWTRLPSDFDQTQWLLEHTNLLNEQKLQWQDRGHEVYVESQNSFRLEGQTATLAGRTDQGVVNDDHALVIDVKSGREQAWHAVQVMIYVYAPCPGRYHSTRTLGSPVRSYTPPTPPGSPRTARRTSS